MSVPKPLTRTVYFFLFGRQMYPNLHTSKVEVYSKHLEGQGPVKLFAGLIAPVCHTVLFCMQ